jgi:TonB family protein
MAGIFPAALSAQNPSHTPKALHVGPGISPPRIIYKAEPEYSPLARADRVQGTVVFSIVVDEHGNPKDLELVSPLGYGLDEKAEEAIRRWRFEPAMKDGRPVPVKAVIQINFRFPRIWFDTKAEERRTSFNLALKNLQDGSPTITKRAVETIQDLAAQKFPAAMYSAGRWEMNGDNEIAKDETDGWRLIQEAAGKNYGPAMYDVAIRALRAGGDPSDLEKQRQTIRDAAVLGSVQAQFYLGEVYEGGVAVPADTARAARYFRLCATKGEPLCRFRLGRLLLAKPDRSEDEYVQGLAWLQLAADQKVDEARALFDSEQPKLSKAQVNSVNTWKSQLSRDPASH